jgi:two-component system OmpR family response regulator
MRVAFLEDDEVIRSNYSDLLESEGYEVHLMVTYQEALDSIIDLKPDVALLDVSLPDDAMAGIKICKLLRENDVQIPVIFLTSHTELDHQSKSWRAGADDYVTKDTNIEMVLLRIRVLLSRYDAIKNKALQSVPCADRIDVDKERLRVTWRGSCLNLSLTQFWMLDALVDKSGQVVTHADLQQAANIVVEPNTIASHIKSIRDEFSCLDGSFNPIATERGKGYRWVGVGQE